MDKYLDNTEPRNLDNDSILLCNERCNLSFNYKDFRNMILSNIGQKLYINYNKESYLTYNIDDTLDSYRAKFFLQNIRLIAPPLHYIGTHNHKMELILTHKAENRSELLHLSILLDVSDSEDEQKKISWKLFKKFAEQLPEQNISAKVVEDIVNWNALDFFPGIEDRSFKEYKMDKKTFIVFTQAVKVPNIFFSNFVKNIVGQDNYDKLSQIPKPLSTPEDIIVYYKRNIIEDPSKTLPQRSAENNYQLELGPKKPKVEIPKESDDVKKEREPEDRYATQIDPCVKKQIESQKEGGLAWYWILLIILGIILFLALGGWIFWNYITEFDFGDLFGNNRNVEIQLEDPPEDSEYAVILARPAGQMSTKTDNDNDYIPKFENIFKENNSEKTSTKTKRNNAPGNIEGNILKKIENDSNIDNDNDTKKPPIYSSKRTNIKPVPNTGSKEKSKIQTQSIPSLPPVPSSPRKPGLNEPPPVPPSPRKAGLNEPPEPPVMPKNNALKFK